MTNQPLAFTLVKTVVTARDEGRELLPAYQTAWGLLRDEMDDEVRNLLEDVRWGPEYQTELRAVIDGVRACLNTDPALEQEFSAFVSDYSNAAEQPADFGDSLAIASTQVELRGAGLSLQDSAAAEGVTFRPQGTAEDPTPDSAPSAASDKTARSSDAEDVEAQEVADDAPANRTDAETGTAVDAPTTTDSSGAAPQASTAESNSGPTAGPEASPIPMIVLEPELLASLDDDPTASAPSETATPEADLAPTPSVEEEPLPVWPPRKTSSPLQAEVPPPAIPIFPDATRGPLAPAPLDPNPPQQSRPRTSWLPWLATGLLVLGLAALGLYFATRDPAVATVPEEGESSRPGDTAVLGPASTIALPIAPEALAFSESGQWDQARDAQRNYIDDLEVANASPAVRADALATLAEYASSAGDLQGAVQAQKSSLDLAKATYGENSAAAGDAHLDLAGYYLKTGELHMARAHLLQGRHLIEQQPADASSDRLARIQQLSDQLE